MEKNKGIANVAKKILGFFYKAKVGVFFNAKDAKKKEVPSREQIKEFIEVYAEELRDKLNQNGVNPELADSDSLSKMSDSTVSKLYDWLSYSTSSDNLVPYWNGPDNKQKDERIAKKPVEVRQELESPNTPISLENIDEKIQSLKEKTRFTNQYYSSQELLSLIERLENRKKYAEHEEFYRQFPYTTDEKVEELVSKYKLVVKSSDLFVPEFPKEAIDVMKQYTERTLQLCDKEPVFYVIAEAQDFEKKYGRRDPILLAQSPFGFFYQILGAWDKEMILLSEL